MDTQNNKPHIDKLYIKLGSDCNLHCKYCHSKHIDFQFNPDIIPVINQLGINHITLSGGEPLLYWDIIKQIVIGCDQNTLFRIVTNGTLFTQEIVDFCNAHRFFIGISLDGIHTTRDTSKPIRWDLISQLNVASTAVTIYDENINIAETLESLNEYKEQYLTVPANILSSFPNFVHSTQDTGALSTHEMAVSYIEQMEVLLNSAFDAFIQGKKTNLLRSGLEIFCKPKTGHGVRCCRETNICMLANGDIYVCPYTLTDKIGDIFHIDEINFQAIEDKYTRPGCKSCSYFNVCKNTCCMNITEDDCYIMRQMHNIIAKLIQQYNIPIKDLESAFNMPLCICK